MRRIFIMICVIEAVFFASCARLNVQTKKPIKVDINMRVDVYQHVVKDVDSLESQVYGEPQSKQLNALFLGGYAYAAEYSQDVMGAIKRRRERALRVEEFLSKGYIGENKEAFLEIVAKDIPGDVKDEVKAVVKEENRDRKIVYKATAEKNGVSLEAAEKIFFKDHYTRGKSGWWFEVYDERAGGYRWVQK